MNFKLFFPSIFSDLTYYKQYKKQDKNSQYNDIYNTTIFHYKLPIFFQIFSDESQKSVSQSCADECVDDEFDQIHFSHTSREWDKVPDNWDKSADKNRDASPLSKKMFCRFQFFLI